MLRRRNLSARTRGGEAGVNRGMGLVAVAKAFQLLHLQLIEHGCGQPPSWPWRVSPDHEIPTCQRQHRGSCAPRTVASNQIQNRTAHPLVQRSGSFCFLRRNPGYRDRGKAGTLMDQRYAATAAERTGNRGQSPSMMLARCRPGDRGSRCRCNVRSWAAADRPIICPPTALLQVGVERSRKACWPRPGAIESARERPTKAVRRSAGVIGQDFLC